MLNLIWGMLAKAKEKLLAKSCQSYFEVFMEKENKNKQTKTHCKIFREILQFGQNMTIRQLCYEANKVFPALKCGLCQGEEEQEEQKTKRTRKRTITRQEGTKIR